MLSAHVKLQEKPENKEDARIYCNADLLLKHCVDGRWAIGLTAARLCLYMYF